MKKAIAIFVLAAILIPSVMTINAMTDVNNGYPGQHQVMQANHIHTRRSRQTLTETGFSTASTGVMMMMRYVRTSSIRASRLLYPIHGMTRRITL